MLDILGRLYRTKMALSCVLLVVSGTILIVIGRRLDAGVGWSWLKPLPWGSLA